MAMSIEDLYADLHYQYDEKRQEYEVEKYRIENVSIDSKPIGRLDLSELNKLREDCIKMEGGLEAIQLVKKHVLGIEDENS